MNSHNTFVFDLDGTLLNTLHDLANSTNHALRCCSLKEREEDEIREFVGNGVRKLIERAVPSGTDEALTDKVFEIFRKHYIRHSLDSTCPYPGIVDMLASLHEAGKKMAIVSNKLQPAVTDLCERFFGDSVSVAIGERPDMARKPAPDMVLAALKALDAGAGDAVYVGDSEVDLLTARNAGLPCISVLWGFRDKEFLLRHGACTLVASPQEIVRGCSE